MARRNTRKTESTNLSWGPMLVSFCLGGFVVFLFQLDRQVEPDAEVRETVRRTGSSIQPTFDFYTVLPETEVVVEEPRAASSAVVSAPPEQVAEAVPVAPQPASSEPQVISAAPTPAPVSPSPAPTQAAATPPTAPVAPEGSAQETSDSFIIQVGSFRQQTDAENLRARLAFMGIESKVQTVTIDNAVTWHRVQIGPVAGRSGADAIQKQLEQSGIDSMLMRARRG